VNHERLAMIRKIPLRNGKLVCCGCCQGRTALLLDVPFSDEYKLKFTCFECCSNWTFVIDDYVYSAKCWRSDLNRQTAELEEASRGNDP
jgi:hypothetical protein